MEMAGEEWRDLAIQCVADDQESLRLSMFLLSSALQKHAKPLLRGDRGFFAELKVFRKRWASGEVN